MTNWVVVRFKNQLGFSQFEFRFSQESFPYFFFSVLSVKQEWILARCSKITIIREERGWDDRSKLQPRPIPILFSEIRTKVIYNLGIETCIARLGTHHTGGKLYDWLQIFWFNSVDVLVKSETWVGGQNYVRCICVWCISHKYYIPE